MRSSCHPFVALVGFCVLLAWAPTAQADYLVSHAFADIDSWNSTMVRIGSNGAVVTDYGEDLPDSSDAGEDDPLRYYDVYNHLEQFESFGFAHAVAPDLQNVYTVTEAFGYLGVVAALDSRTGQFVMDQSFCAPQPHAFGYYDEGVVHNPRQPVIHGDDLFVLSDFWDGGMFEIDGRHIVRFDLSAIESPDGPYAQTIAPPTPQDVYDIEFRPSSNMLFYSAEDGIFTYDVDRGFGPAVPLIAGVAGLMTFGPDGSLYVLNDVTGNVERYNPSTGALVGTVLTAAAAGGEISALEFGVDGNLHALVPGMEGGSVLKVNGTTGQVMSALELPPELLFTWSRQITYLPIPEPATATLLLLGAAVLWHVRRRA